MSALPGVAEGRRWRGPSAALRINKRAATKLKGRRECDVKFTRNDSTKVKCCQV